MFKTAYCILGMVVIFLTGGIGYGKLQMNQIKTEEKVVENKAEIKENIYSIDKNENKIIEHAIVLERTVKLLDKLEEKLK